MSCSYNNWQVLKGIVGRIREVIFIEWARNNFLIPWSSEGDKANVTRIEFITIITTKNQYDKASETYSLGKMKKHEQHDMEVSILTLYQWYRIYIKLLKPQILLCWCGMLKLE